uniref:NADH-ubiquinone oxidoreductase chain 1 n=1 Tax=Cyriopagopus hainanus TaxID=2781057 RepID=A0A7M1IC42_CYRHA|nr:NADH dehydrogenase subunit 1 [Cyriopagopus hainanus]QOQ36846.1 NADH dehydrogenase subunit 1 [Cyriopagopus hainanus]
MINLLLILISSLISVAFYTVLERKILGYIQIRKGPNKVGFLGIFQPFSDAIKLFSKALIVTETANKFLMAISPAISFIFALSIWPFIPFANQGLLDSNFSILAFFIISSASVYSIILIGWASNSKYCYLGSIRSVAQMISYEVSLFLIIISITVFLKSYNLTKFLEFQSIFPIILLSLLAFTIWMITCIAETNRAPFDFAEGESELVSGFNVEYASGLFAMIFLAEYLSMISLSIITAIMFMGNSNKILSISLILMTAFFFLWIRGTFPRFRYDLLMILNWKIFLPMSISYVLIAFFSSFLGL